MDGSRDQPGGGDKDDPANTFVWPRSPKAGPPATGSLNAAHLSVHVASLLALSLCHEGNGAVGNALSGERAYDRAVAEAIKAGRPIPARAPIGMEVYGNAPLEGREAVREFGTGR